MRRVHYFQAKHRHPTTNGHQMVFHSTYRYMDCYVFRRWINRCHLLEFGVKMHNRWCQIVSRKLLWNAFRSTDLNRFRKLSIIYLSLSLYDGMMHFSIMMLNTEYFMLCLGHIINVYRLDELLTAVMQTNRWIIDTNRDLRTIHSNRV